MCFKTGTYDVQHATIESNGQNTLNVHFAENNSALGVFGVFIPSSYYDDTICINIGPRFMVLPKCQLGTNLICDYILRHIPLDMYQLFLYDIENNGLLSSPVSLPAISIYEVVLGSKYVYHYSYICSFRHKN